MELVKNAITQGLSDLGSNISKFFSDLGENIGSWFADTLEDIGEFNTSVGTWFSDLGSNIATWFSNLGTSLGNWFADLGSNLKNLLSYINPFDENFLGKKLVELIGDLLNDLFVPKDDIFGNLKDNLQSKFYFTTQIQEIFENLLNDFNYGDSVPSFTITYYGKTLDIIDFSPYLEYRSWLHAIILGISWFVFIRKTFYKIPKIIGGI